MKIDFFKLPIVAQEHTLRYLNPIDLFELSLCSREARELVKNLNIPAEAHFITLTEGQYCVHVQFPGKRRTIWWDFKSIVPKSELNEVRRVGDVVFLNCEKFRQGSFSLDEYYCDYDNLEEGVAEVSRHFQYLFPGPLRIVLSPTSHKNLGVLFGDRALQYCESLELCGSKMPTPEVLDLIFRSLEIEKKLFVRPETGMEYSIVQALEVEELYLRDAKWMQLDHLLQLKCQTAEFTDHFFLPQDFEFLAEHWMNGGCPNLERIRFGWLDDTDFQLENLKVSNWNSQKRERNFIYYVKNEAIRIDCSTSYDFEREDGTIGSIVFEDIEYNSSVYFLVWKEPFPEKKRLEKLPENLERFYRQLDKINRDFPDATSLERMLSNRQLNYKEFVETYNVLRNMDGETTRPQSAGRAYRRGVFDKMYRMIGI